MTNLNTSLLDYSDLYYLEFNYTYGLNISEFIPDEKTIPCTPIATSDAINIGVCAFFIQVFLLAIPGNLIVGCVIISNRRTLSPSDIYLVHLIIADTLLALILPLSATSVMLGWIFGDFMCKLVSFIKEANFYTSILFLVCISVDRYMLIVRAMEARKAHRIFCTWTVCTLVWFMGILLSLPAFYNEVFSIKGHEVQICAERFELESSDEWRLATRAMRHLLGFLLPLAVMLTCYGVTVARLLRTRGFQRQRAMKVIAAVMIAFLLCWMPFHIATMVDTLLRAKLVENGCTAQRAVSFAMFVTQSLALLHCCVNPVLYAFVAEKFRKRLFRMLGRNGAFEREVPLRSTRVTCQNSEGTSSFL